MAEPDGKKKDGEDGDAGTGMDLQELKKALARSRRAKMNVALAQGDAKTGGAGLIMIDKATPPKAGDEDAQGSVPDGEQAVLRHGIDRHGRRSEAGRRSR